MIYVYKYVIKTSFSELTLQNFKQIGCICQKGKKFKLFCYQNPQNQHLTLPNMQENSKIGKKNKVSPVSKKFDSSKQNIEKVRIKGRQR